MRILAKKSLQFDHPDKNSGEMPVIVLLDNFADVPDWVSDSNMFKLALKDESVIVIDSKQAELTAELSTEGKSNKELTKAEAKAKKEAEAKAKAEAAEAEAKAKAEEEAAAEAAAAGNTSTEE